MTKKLPIAALLFFTTWFINSACKKSDAPTTGGPAVNNNVSSSGDPNGTFSGFFVEDSSPGEDAAAVFYNTPIALHLSTIYPPTPTGTVTSVYCNGVKFVYDPSNIEYDDSTNTSTYPPAAWAVTGNANFPSFTYTCTTAMPTYNNAVSLPTTINRNQNLTISTHGASNYDQILVSIYDAAGHSTANLAASSAAASLICVKDTLAKLSPTSFGTISITLYKYNPQILGGKNYLFITTTNFNQSNVVIQ